MIEGEPGGPRTMSRSAVVMIREPSKRGWATRLSGYVEELVVGFGAGFGYEELAVLAPDVSQDIPVDVEQEHVRAGLPPGHRICLVIKRVVGKDYGGRDEAQEEVPSNDLVRSKVVETKRGAETVRVQRPDEAGTSGGEATMRPNTALGTEERSHFEGQQRAEVDRSPVTAPPRVMREAVQEETRAHVERLVPDIGEPQLNMKCTEEQKVKYATFMLDGDAQKWRAERLVLPEAGKGLGWAEFLERFRHHYIPNKEYDNRFRSLSQFVSWAQTNLIDVAHKFQEGLKLSIRGKVAPLKLQDYAEILDRARVIE
ncbi:hypothetical protein ACLOJK_036827 [Asimina triloba]